MMRKNVPGWKDQKSYPGQANFSNISLQSEASRLHLHEREKKLAWPEW